MPLAARRFAKKGTPFTIEERTIRALQAETRPIRSDALWHSLTCHLTDPDGEHLWDRDTHNDTIGVLVRSGAVLRLQGGLLVATGNATPFQVAEARALRGRA